MVNYQQVTINNKQINKIKGDLKNCNTKQTKTKHNQQVCSHLYKFPVHPLCIQMHTPHISMPQNHDRSSCRPCHNLHEIHTYICINSALAQRTIIEREWLVRQTTALKPKVIGQATRTQAKGKTFSCFQLNLVKFSVCGVIWEGKKRAVNLLKIMVGTPSTVENHSPLHLKEPGVLIQKVPSLHLESGSSLHSSISDNTQNCNENEQVKDNAEGNLTNSRIEKLIHPLFTSDCMFYELLI